jgi:hypothetical protein
MLSVRIRSILIHTWRPPCRPRPALHYNKVDNIVLVRTWFLRWRRRGPNAAVEITCNFDGPLVIEKSGAHRENIIIVLSMLVTT